MLANAIFPSIYRSYALFALILIAISTLELYAASPIPYSGIALHLYLSIGLFITFFGYLVFIVQRSARDATEVAFEQAAARFVREQLPLLTRIRGHLSSWAAALISFFCWPVVFFSAQTLQFARSPAMPTGTFEVSAFSSLFLLDMAVSIYTMLVSIGLTLLALNSDPPFAYSIYFLVLLAIVTGIRHLIYVIGVETVQTRLRRSSGSPVIRFVAIALFDLISIVLVYNAVVNWNAPIGPFDLSAIRGLVEQLYAFGEVIDLFKRPVISPISYGIMISGLLYYAALGRSVTRIGEFERNDDDIAFLAIKLAMIGRSGEAIRWLEQMKEPGKKGLLAATMIYASAGNIERGKAYARRYLAVIDVDQTPNYQYMLMAGGHAVLPTRKESALELVTKAMSDGVGDTVVIDLIKSILSRQRVTVAALLDLVSSEERKSAYPLSFCYLKWMVDEEAEVLSFFDRTGEGVEGSPRMLWLVMHPLMRMFIVDENDLIATVEQWKEEYLPELEALNGEVKDSVEKLSILGFLLQFVQTLGAKGIGGWEPIQGVAKHIEASVEVNEVTLNALRWLKKEGGAPGRI